MRPRLAAHTPSALGPEQRHSGRGGIGLAAHGSPRRHPTFRPVFRATRGSRGAVVITGEPPARAPYVIGRTTLRARFDTRSSVRWRWERDRSMRARSIGRRFIARMWAASRCRRWRICTICTDRARICARCMQTAQIAEPNAHGEGASPHRVTDLPTSGP